MERPAASVMSGGLAYDAVSYQPVEDQTIPRSENQVISSDQPPKPTGHDATEPDAILSKPGSVFFSSGRSNEDPIPETDATKPDTSDMKRKKQRRQSFFVVPDNPGHDIAQKEFPEMIEIGPLQRSPTFEIGKPKQRALRDADRSSLEEVLRHAMNGPIPGCVEAQLPLPESRDGSISSVSENATQCKNTSRSSLEIIDQHGEFPNELIPGPATFPLPDSPAEPVLETNDMVPPTQLQQQDASFTQGSRINTQPPRPLTMRRLKGSPFNYEKIKQRAAENFEHMKRGKIHSRSHHNNMNITLIDFLDSGISKSVPVNSQREDAALRYLIRNIPAGIRQRLLIVEDDSKRTIDLLGSLYGISPEFFEEHLINSGYEGPKYDDPPAQTWTTSEMKKSYVSMKWYRPVWRLDVVPYSNSDLDDLLDPETSRLKYTSSNSNDLVVYQTETNLFRSDWSLWTDPKTTPRMKRVCGWEERASIWSHKLPDRDCNIAILLLDPLPKVSEGIERVVTATRRIEHSDAGSLVSTDSDHTHGSGFTENQHIMDAEEMERVAQHLKARNVGKKPPTKLDKFLQGLWFRAAGQRTANDDDASQLSQAYEVVETKQVKKIRSRNIFEQTASRARFDIDLEIAFQSPQHTEELRGQLYDTKSTRECFDQWFGTSENKQVIETPFGVMTPLCHIVKKDTTSLLKILHRTLDDINNDILDDMKMEDRLALWRQLIIRAQDELPEMKRSIKGFFSFFEGQLPVDDEEKKFTFKEVQGLLQQIDDMRLKLSTASASLTSNMALLESKRSIAEAQSVTKLTELAFFFIPLTFAASIFGMQIEQFENRAPLSTFIILGIAFTAFSYLIRLVIRSMWMRHLKEACGESIKLYADHKRQPVQRNSVPASLFIQWMGHEFVLSIQIVISRSWDWVTTNLDALLSANGSFILSMFLVALIVVGPITVLWTRDINHGTQAIITVIVLVVVIVLIITVQWRPRSATRSALRRMLLKNINVKDLRSTVFRLIILACLMATVIVPLALIWTKPVAPGIRVAITTVIILMVVMGLFTFGIYKLIAAARIVDSSEGSSSSLVSE